MMLATVIRHGLRRSVNAISKAIAGCQGLWRRQDPLPCLLARGLEPFEANALLCAIDGYRLRRADAKRIEIREEDFASWLSQEKVDTPGFDASRCFVTLAEYLCHLPDPVNVAVPGASFLATAANRDSIVLNPLGPFEPASLLAAINKDKLCQVRSDLIEIGRENLALWLEPRTVRREGFDPARCFAKLNRYLRRLKLPIRISAEHAAFFVSAKGRKKVLVKKISLH
ncbi:MAG TPA: hypothetical protein VM487_15725 [Phycisphaerae bacterium]|nr:hypothetical protein [Phycisphaerae bacterium]